MTPDEHAAAIASYVHERMRGLERIESELVLIRLAQGVIACAIALGEPETYRELTTRRLALAAASRIHAARFN